METTEQIIRKQKTIEKMRIAMSAALKYHPGYGMSLNLNSAASNLWRKVAAGDKIPTSLVSEIGDIFAFWYSELHLPSDIYFEVAKSFFEKE